MIAQQGASHPGRGTPVTEAVYLCHDNSEDLCEDPASCRYAERDDPELVMVVSYMETEKFPVDWMNVNMDVGILHVESHEPGPLRERGDKRCQHHHAEFGFPDKDVQ